MSRSHLRMVVEPSPPHILGGLGHVDGPNWTTHIFCFRTMWDKVVIVWPDILCSVSGFNDADFFGVMLFWAKELLLIFVVVLWFIFPKIKGFDAV